MNLTKDDLTRTDVDDIVSAMSSRIDEGIYKTATNMNPYTIASCKGKPVCQECIALGYCPTPTEGERPDITKTLLAIKDAMPAGSRMMACASMAVITLGDQIPHESDINACIGFLRAMKRTKEKAPNL